MTPPIRKIVLGLTAVLAASILIGLIVLPSGPSQSVTPQATVATGMPPISLPLGAARPAGKLADLTTFYAGTEYIGSRACQSCHQQQYGQWRQTWHARMVHPQPSPRTQGDFNNSSIIFHNIPALKSDGANTLKISPKMRLFVKANGAGRPGQLGFTLLDQDNPANNQSYDIETVFGGRWLEGYMVRIGNNLYPAPIRWVVADRAWQQRGFRPGNWFMADDTSDGRPRRPEEMSNLFSSEAKCSGCHRTGFRPKTERRTGKVRIEIAGEDGIGCEACHGPGSRHAKSEDPAHIIQPSKDLNALQQSQLCASCHHRGTNRLDPKLSYPVGFLPGQTDLDDNISMWHFTDPARSKSNHFWPNGWSKRNRQQWQDFQKSSHFNKTDVTCITCHKAHGPSSDHRLRLPRDQICSACHSLGGLSGRPNSELFAGSPMAKAGVTCVDCHMAKTAQRAGRTSTDKYGLWDVSAHTFRVVTPAMAKAYGLPSACQSCHSDNRSKLTVPEAHQQMAQQQRLIRRMIGDVQGAIKAAQLRRMDRAVLDAAQSSLKTILLDGSHGAHNFPKTRALLTKAIAELKEQD